MNEEAETETQQAVPHATTPREVFWWTVDRNHSLETSVIRQYQSADFPRLPGWDPHYVANVSLGMRFSAQGAKGKNAARKLMRTAQGLVAYDLKAGADVAIPYELDDVHVTIAYLRPIDLRQYCSGLTVDDRVIVNGGRNPDGSPHAGWPFLVQRVANEHSDPILRIAMALDSGRAFDVVYRGFQVLNNSLAARMAVGGDKLNEVTAAVRTALPEMRGNDPFVAPSDTGSIGTWGMAGHATMATYSDGFDLDRALELAHQPGRGIEPNVGFTVNKLTLDLQTWGTVRNRSRELVGRPFRHVGELASFDLGVERNIADGGRTLPTPS